MVTLTSYNSGALRISDDQGTELNLEPAAANRLIMAARMKSIEPFLEKLPDLIPDEALAKNIVTIIAQAQGSDRWNLKEKFARLLTVAPGHPVEQPNEVLEVVSLSV